VLQSAAVRCGVLQCAAVCCRVAQCAAVCRSVPQCGAVWRSVLQFDRVDMGPCVLQCAAVCCCEHTTMRWLRLVGSLKTQVSFAKEPYKRDYILQKRLIFVKSLLIKATPYLIPYLILRTTI